MKLIFILLCLLFNSFAYSEGFFSESSIGENSIGLENLVTEKVQKISASKRIFIITNENNSFGKGDFLTFFLNGIPFARSLAAKNNNNVSGVKILKIYSMDIWKKVREGDSIQILRGDDSYFRNRNDGSNEEQALKIKAEEDLFNDTILEEDADLEEKDKRSIKTDNIISFVYGQIEGLNNDGTVTGYYQFNASWDFQVEDNIWLGISYGQNLAADYPTPGLDTKLSNIVFKLKYTIKAPLFSFVMPYVGYQILDANSPGAGREDPSCTSNCPSATDLELEVLKVDDMKKSTVVFGLSILRRLVPAWFIKVNIGTDIISAGLALEF